MTIPSLIIKFTNKNERFKYHSKTKSLDIRYKGFFDQPGIFKKNDNILFIFGNPIVKNEINMSKTANLIFNQIDPYVNLNGQFLIINFNKKSETLKIINDRFSSLSIYYTKISSNFFASFSYLELLSCLEIEKKKIKLNGNVLFEFLLFQRVLHDKTYDNFTRFLSPANVLKFENNQITQTQYWSQNFNEKSRNLYHVGEELHYLLKRNISILKTKFKKIALFLSGGHDSRTILSFLDNDQFETQTVSFSENYELNSARKLSRLMNIKNNFIKINENHFYDNLDEMIEITSGYYSIINCLFNGLPKNGIEKFDALIHGHGLDYMFHGMYLPNENINFLGRPTFFKKNKIIPKENIAEYFINNVKFRLTEINLFSFLNEKEKKRKKDFLIDSINSVLISNKNLERSIDKWNYLITHCLSRHYSYPNNLGLMTYSNQFVLAFENDIFDLFLSTPNKLKVYGKILDYVTKKNCYKLSMVPTANFGIPPGLSPFSKTAWLIGRKLLRSVTGINSLKTPHAIDRTWPDQSEYIHNNKNMGALVEKSLKSEKLRDNLNYFDWKKIDKEYLVFKQKKNHKMGKFLFALLTIERFLEKI